MPPGPEGFQGMSSLEDTEEASIGTVFIKPTARFKSLSILLPSPVAGLYTCLIGSGGDPLCLFSQGLKEFTILFDGQERLKGGLGIITLASIMGVFVFEGIVDKGGVNGIKEDFKGVIGWDEGGDFKVDEIKLSLFSHSVSSSFWN